MKHFKEFKLNEGQETGLYVTPSTRSDGKKLEKWLKKSDFHAEKYRDGSFFFPDDPDTYDELEMELDKQLSDAGIFVTYEGV